MSMWINVSVSEFSNKSFLVKLNLKLLMSTWANFRHEDSSSLSSVHMLSDLSNTKPTETILITLLRVIVNIHIHHISNFQTFFRLFLIDLLKFCLEVMLCSATEFTKLFGSQCGPNWKLGYINLRLQWEIIGEIGTRRRSCHGNLTTGNFNY